MILPLVTASLPLGLQEKRIASVYRGAGPRGSAELGVVGFDAFCLTMAVEKGARRIPQRVEEVQRLDDGVLVRARGHRPEKYALLAVATGINTNALRLFPSLEPRFRPPVTVRSLQREYRLGSASLSSPFQARSNTIASPAVACFR